MFSSCRTGVYGNAVEVRDYAMLVARSHEQDRCRAGRGCPKETETRRAPA